jgi:DNA invertase Pin-like site-specific DNA recombinase
MLQQEVARRRRKPRKTPGDVPRVIAYVRVSTEEQAVSGNGLAAQRDAITAEVARRKWSEVTWIEDAGYSAKNLDRPGIRQALARLSEGNADVLVVAKLDRLSRSLLDFAGLMERSEHEEWSLVALDLGVDTTTPQGEMMAGVLALFAQFERRLISQRTKAGLAVVKARGEHRIGRPVELPGDVRERIAALRQSGMTYAAIAQTLNREDVPTARTGKQWFPATVHNALKVHG